MRINPYQGDSYATSVACFGWNNNCSNHTERDFQRGAKSGYYRSDTKEAVKSISCEEGALYGDLLLVFNCTELRVKHLLYAKLGDSITVKERKTGKTNVFVVNKEIKKAFDEYYIDAKPDENHFPFRSRKGANYPLTTFRVTRLVKEWGAMIGLKQNLGAHTLRKTFCWFQRMKYGTSWEVLSRRLNHSSPSITRCYLGITDECVEEILHHTI